MLLNKCELEITVYTKDDISKLKLRYFSHALISGITVYIGAVY